MDDDETLTQMLEEVIDLADQSDTLTQMLEKVMDQEVDEQQEEEGSEEELMEAGEESRSEDTAAKRRKMESNCSDEELIESDDNLTHAHADSGEGDVYDPQVLCDSRLVKLKRSFDSRHRDNPKNSRKKLRSRKH